MRAIMVVDRLSVYFQQEDRGMYRIKSWSDVYVRNAFTLLNKTTFSTLFSVIRKSNIDEMDNKGHN